MTIVHRLLDDGSFVAGDTESGRTALGIALPSETAAARDLANAAADLLAWNEEDRRRWPRHWPKSILAIYDARNWRLLNGAKDGR